MIIIVSGSPGTGKTTVAKQLAERLDYAYINVNKFIKENGLSDGYDKERECEIVDTNNLNKELIAFIKPKQNLVIDSHLSHYLPRKVVDLCIITKCGIVELKHRLEKRGYSKEKVKENIEVEIFDSCRVEAEDAGHNVVVVDTSKGFDIDGIIKGIK